MISLNNIKYLSPHTNTDDNTTHEYVNLQMVNEYSPNNTLPKTIIFNQTKTTNVLDVAGDYYLSVIRWNIQSNLPVLIPDMLLYPPNQHYSGLTSYHLSLFFTTNNGDVFNNPSANPYATLVYTPETSNPTYLSTLLAGTNKEDILSNPFYYIRNVDTVCQMINNAINGFFATIAGATWVNKPYFQWDAVAQKLVYYQSNTQPTNVPGTDASTGWYLAVNQPLYNLLSTFRFSFYPANSGNINYPNTDCRYVLNSNIIQSQSQGDYTPYYQQSSSVVNWSPVQSIVFVSSTMPLEPQFAGAPDNLNIFDPSAQSTIYQQQNLLKVLTDFIIPFQTGTEASNSQVYYIPQSEYRLIDLLGNSALNQLTIQVFWRDKYGTFHPMTLDAGASADLLILLRKKTFNRQ